MRSITLPYPPSANKYWSYNKRTGQVYRTEEAKAYIEEVGWACLAQGMSDPLAGTVSLRMEIHHEEYQRQDTDNSGKVLIDALQGFSYLNDRQIVHLEMELVLLPHKVDPFVIATVTPREVRIWGAE